MTDTEAQTRLSTAQIEAFYHDEFVEDQVRDFTELVSCIPDGGVVVDIGGGCGYFAAELKDRAGWRTRVVDSDPGSIVACRRNAVEAVNGNALAPEVAGDEDIVCFNLILHHLIGPTDTITRSLQSRALTAWHGRARAIFVNEYIYQSFIGTVSGWLIYQITSNRLLSWIGTHAAKIVPAFKANTFGIGVRFRAHEEWRRLFAEAGYRVTGFRIGRAEHVSPPLRSMLIRTIRRDSFLIEPVAREF